jgi:ABC-type xylose transport system permease subunit
MSDAAVATADTEEGLPRRKQTIRRLVQGDLASLRVVIGLALIWAIFQFENERFLSAQNLTNLMLQIAATGLISMCCCWGRSTFRSAPSAASPQR